MANKKPRAGGTGSTGSPAVQARAERRAEQDRGLTASAASPTASARGQQAVERWLALTLEEKRAEMLDQLNRIGYREPR